MWLIRSNRFWTLMVFHMSRSFKDSPEKRQQNFASKKERGAHRKMEPYSRSNMKVFAKEFYSVDGDYQR